MNKNSPELRLESRHAMYHRKRQNPDWLGQPEQTRNKKEEMGNLKRSRWKGIFKKATPVFLHISFAAGFGLGVRVQEWSVPPGLPLWRHGRQRAES